MKIILNIFLLVFLSGCIDLGVDSYDPVIPEDHQIILVDDINDLEFADDPAGIYEAELIGDNLRLKITYSGGCEYHYFAIFGSRAILLSNPPMMDIYLSHNANDDMCEAALSENILFDLTPLKNELQQNLGTGTIQLRIHEPGTDIIYNPIIEYNF